MLKVEDIWEVVINTEKKTISVFTEDGNAVVFPMTAKGGTEIKYAKVSAGGLIIQSLIRMISDLSTRGGGLGG